MLKHAPSVSVVIPCFNVGAFVSDAIASVFAQTHPVAEVICVDDGSTDNTLEVLREHGEASPVPFRVLTGPNGGAPRARNRGTIAARGEYLQYLDADDVLLSEKIEHQLAIVQGCTAPPALVAAAYFHVDFDDESRRQQVEVEADPWVALLGGRLGITSSNLWGRAAVVSAGGWDEGRRTSQDTEIAFRMLRGGALIVTDPVPLTRKRQRRGSLFNAEPEASTVGWWRLRREMFAYLREHGRWEPRMQRAVANRRFWYLRELFLIDPALAVSLHREIAPSGVNPRQAGCSASYAATYALLGFERTERVAAWRRRNHHAVALPGLLRKWLRA